MSSQQLSQFSVDRYVVIHVATTCDEHGVYVTKDSAEVIELGWILIDANSMEEVSISHRLELLSRAPSFVPFFSCRTLLTLTFFPLFVQLVHESVLVKPVNTPITPLCSRSTEFSKISRPSQSPSTRTRSLDPRLFPTFGLPTIDSIASISTTFLC